MRGRKHNTERHNEVPKAHQRKHGGKAGAGAPKEADGNPYVFAEAKKAHNVGVIGGEKSKARADRRHGGKACRAGGGSTHSDAAEDREMIHKMVKGDALTGAKHGGKAHRAHGGKVGSDSSPYSSAGRGLRRGGNCG